MRLPFVDNSSIPRVIAGVIGGRTLRLTPSLIILNKILDEPIFLESAC